LLFNQGSNATQRMRSAVNFSGSSTVTLATTGFNGHNAYLDGALSGGGTLTLQGAGALGNQRSFYITNANNDFTGKVVLGGSTTGSTSLALNTSVGNADWEVTNATWTVTVSNTTQVFKSLTSSVNTLFTSSGAAARLDIGSGNTSTTYAGRLGGTLGLTKSGTGTLTLSGASTYTGTTQANAGSLAVGATGTLRINGTAGITIASGAEFALNGVLNLNALTDTIVNDGTLTLGVGSVLRLNNIFDGDSSRTSYLLVTTGGTGVTGNFTTVDGYSTSVFSSVVFDNATGQLLFTAVPEPSTYGLLGAGALAALAMVRRRRAI